MIKFTSRDKDGRTLIGLGLSDENLKRLRADQPIPVDLRDLGVEGPRLLIFAGRDEETMRAQLAEWTTLPDEKQRAAVRNVSSTTKGEGQ